MRKKLVYILTAVILSLGAYGFPMQEPPTPGNDTGGPCGQPDRGRGVPPPVGLCLPINDYLLPLLLCGIILGAYKVRPGKKT